MQPIKSPDRHTNTHTHRQRERERETESTTQMSEMNAWIFFDMLNVSGTSVHRQIFIVVKDAYMYTVVHVLLKEFEKF